MRRSACLFLLVSLGASCGGHATSRLDRIRQRGVLVCGVSPGIAGFAQVDGGGHYTGFDIDFCRAVAAAVAGSADRIRFERVDTLDAFLRSSDIDLVSRRLTWTLGREGMGVLFGPVTFYDGQSFLVADDVHVDGAGGLANVPICVAENSEHDVSLIAYFARTHLALNRVPVADGAAAGRALAEGKCRAFSADISELASVRSAMTDPRAYRILADRITSEPLAQLVRREDVDLLSVLRWTVLTMIAADESRPTSSGVVALGLDEAWARRVITEVGSYADVWARNLAPLGLERVGPNAPSSSGGLLFAPPLK